MSELTFMVRLDLSNCSFVLTGTEPILLAADNSLSGTRQHSNVRDGGEGKNAKAKYKTNKPQTWTQPPTAIKLAFVVTAQEAKKLCKKLCSRIRRIQTLCSVSRSNSSYLRLMGARITSLLSKRDGLVATPEECAGCAVACLRSIT